MLRRRRGIRGRGRGMWLGMELGIRNMRAMFWVAVCGGIGLRGLLMRRERGGGAVGGEEAVVAGVSRGRHLVIDP